MVDYYSVLLRAVTTPGAGDAQWRRGIYDRARQMLANRLRTLRPQPSTSEMAAEQAALEAAIDRIETELAWAEGDAGATAAATDDSGAGDADMDWTETRRESALPDRSGPVSWILLAIIVAALGAGGYVMWTTHRTNSAQAKLETPKTDRSKADVAKPATLKPEAAKAPSPQPARASNAAKDGELAAGIDGGSSDPDQPYVFRRQPTYYRTLQPAGTIIVDKLQHFLYLIQPNSVALRYGIGLGDQCKDLAGLRHIASKAEWPPWEATPDMIKRRLASAGMLPGGPGNPLGARLLTLDDGTSRIHGTNAPKTIGGNLAFGCIRLANDDIVDLYNRVSVNTPVVMN